MGLNISVIPQGIVVYTFSDLKRETMEAWGDYSLSFKDKLPQRIRGLYDLRQCKMVNQFIIDYQNEIIRQLDLPDDTRSAYVVDTNFQVMWTRLIYKNIDSELVTPKAFTNFDHAVTWLNE